MMKRYLILIIFLMLVGLLVGCGYIGRDIPTGEVYLKSPATSYAPGEGEEFKFPLDGVVDIEIASQEYNLNVNSMIPIKVGIGYPRGAYKYGEANPFHTARSIALRIDVYDQVQDILTDHHQINYADFYTDQYRSTTPSRFLFYYGEFFPRHHEELDVEISPDIQEGYIEVAMILDHENESWEDLEICVIQLHFTIEDSIVTFYESPQD